MPGPVLVDAILSQLPARKRAYVRDVLERAVLDGTLNLNNKLELILPE
jgi:hypothetical protein